jgi:hypothetical protein
MILNSASLQSILSMIGGEREKDSSLKMFEWRTEAQKRSIRNSWSHLELLRTAGPKSKSGPQKFRNGDLSFKNTPHTGRPALTLGSQLTAFLQNYPFASAWVLAHHFMTSMSTMKEILQRELGLKNFRGAGWPIFCPPPKELLMLKHWQRC